VSATLSPNALELVLRHEGLNQAARVPPADSGVTLGYGYDLAHHSAGELLDDWRPFLSDNQLLRLKAVVGLSGESARSAAKTLGDIVVSPQAARAVFLRSSVPKYMAMTVTAFPGFEVLPADAQGALFSLVYNRGPSMVGDRRKEMRAIRDAVAKGDLKEITVQLRAMKRLWVGQGLPGLLKRRDDEAALVESCIIVESP